MKTILLLMLIVSVHAWGITRKEVSTDGTNCLINNKVRTDLEVWQESGQCKSNICFSDDDRFYVETYSCRNFPSRPPCYIVKGDVSKPWPGCCDKLAC